MPKLPKSIVVETFDGSKEIELWDAQNYESDNSLPLLGIKVTDSLDNEILILIDKDEINKLVKFLKSLI